MRKSYPLVLVCAALVLFLTICYRIIETPFWSVNGSRLMPAFALARGVDYYVLIPPGGPLYSTLYGPLVAIVYWPATLFRSPNHAVLAGSVLTALLCFSAAAFLHFSGPRAIEATNVLAFLSAGFLMCYLDPLKYSCFNIHADGPGLALGAAACGLLFTSRLQSWRAALPLSALCAVAAIFCKQMFLPLPLFLLLYVATSAGRRTAWQYLIWLVLAAVLGSGASLWAYGAARLYHCLIWLPGHHPWNQSSWLVSWVQSARQFLRLSMPVPVLWLAGILYLAASSHRRAGFRWLALTSRGGPLLLAGLALLPFSIAGRAKTGGDINSFSFALFFLVCGLTLTLADLMRDPPVAAARPVAGAILAAVLLPLVLSEAPLMLDLRSRAAKLADAPQQQAFTYLSRHPGAAYFPWLPLSHYYAEHQFRHYSFGLLDRELAGERISQTLFREYIPRDPRMIGFAADGTPDAFGRNLMQYLPEYAYQTVDPELPGWLVYARTPPVTSPAAGRSVLPPH